MTVFFAGLPMRRIAWLSVLWLAGCSITSLAPEPYKVEIQQGNVITQDMVARLAPGMTRAQVRFLLGSPPITDPFHANRWDYVYRLAKGGKLVEERKLTLFFENDQLVRVAGDVVPLTAEDRAQAEKQPVRGVNEIVLSKADPDAPPAPVPEEKGFFGRVLEKIGF